MELSATRYQGNAPVSRLQFDDDDFMDVDVEEILTPARKGMPKLLSPLVDEDSGLGMEQDEVISRVSNVTSDITDTPKFTFDILNDVSFDEGKENSFVPKSLFHQHGHLLSGNDVGSYSKKRKKRQAFKKSVIKKSLSFGDSPLVRAEEAVVKHVVSRMTDNDNLIGDGSKICGLPTIPGKHRDLKSVTCDTVADVLNGKYDDMISKVRLIDCRYPYEYEGGHVQGAENIYREENIRDILLNADLSEDGKRSILIFYCEFSSERGPKMYRKLRNADREINKDRYPHLLFPEIYLMHDGYKNFFQEHKDLCIPQSYKPMLHKDHSSDLRHFRSKSKSWSSGDKFRGGAQKLIF